MADNKKVTVTLVKSPIGAKETHKRTVKALGLSKLNSVKDHTLTESVQGMINQVSYLVKVEEA